MFSDVQLSEIAVNFIGKDKIQGVKSLGNGLINDTFLIDISDNRLVLQRLNSNVFHDPVQIMENLQTLVEHLSGLNLESIRLRLPNIIPTKLGDLFYCDDSGNIWRALEFIEPSITIENIDCYQDAEQVGFALGHFHWLFNNLSPEKMHDTLPGFHITPEYFERYLKVTDNIKSRTDDPEYLFCKEFVERHEYLVATLEQPRQEGILKTRVIHGDPKLNNFLFDPMSRKVISLIDLDTVKPGLLHYDIGDCIRSLCQRPGTYDFDLTACHAFLKTYMQQAKNYFNFDDYRHILTAIKLIPFELGLRFFTDYLEGNRYFKVTHPAQNLNRSAQQFRLCASILEQQHEITDIIESLSNTASGF